MALVFRLIARADGGVGFKGGFIRFGHPLDLDIEQFRANMVQFHTLADEGHMDIMTSIDGGTTFVAATADQALSAALEPSILTSVRQVSYIDLQADATVINLYGAGGTAAGTILAAAFTGAQMNAPRNIKGVFTGANSTFPIDLTIHGYDINGEAISEDLRWTVAATQTGSKAFAYVTSLVLGDNITAGDTLSIQMGSKIGMPFPISSTGLKFVTINGTYEPGSDFTVNDTYNTILETGQTISASDDYVIYAVPFWATGY